MWVEGEVTNYRGAAASRHRYFSLKDEGAQIRAVLFRGSGFARGLGFELAEGQKVLAHGRVSVYEPRGEYQLVADRLGAQGRGRIADWPLSSSSASWRPEGLFDAAHKRALAAYPRHIVVITSPDWRRHPRYPARHRQAPLPRGLTSSVLPVRVQGEGAKDEISAPRCATPPPSIQADLVLLARGGGSLEDLWAFNEEVVARAIYDCRLPVISAVGHEVDFSIADFTADVRAPTPSAAAEILSPSLEALSLELRQWRNRAAQALKRLLAARRRIPPQAVARAPGCAATPGPSWKRTPSAWTN